MSISLRTKIISSFSIVFALLSFLGALSLYNRNLIYDGMMDVEAASRDLKYISDLKLSLDMAVMPANDYLITGDPAEKGRFVGLVKDVEERFALLKGAGMYDEGIKEAEKKFGLLKEKSMHVLASPPDAHNRRDAALMEEIDALALDIIANHLDRVYLGKRDEMSSRVEAASTLRHKVDAILFAVAAVSFLAIVGVAAYLFRSILRPIDELTKGAAIIGNGDLGHRVDIKDGIEMNLLADEFNRMAGRLGESYAELEKKIAERTKELNEANGRLLALSITDGLTGAYNHRHFAERLEDELKRSARYGKRLSLIMSDIDHFKSYNDLNGHPAGDAVLAGVAESLKEGIRGQDLLARYGGEEFSIILPETGKEEACLMAERIRARVREKVFPNESDQPEGALTMSFGVASCPEDAATAEDLLKKADDALYRAKEAGRDRVERA
ncbi:MAG: diguanylate cyclase [Deltaproteobacteria bacterium]|nr:diguanylate cyclase [Deltaproteobacteria bacterium]